MDHKNLLPIDVKPPGHFATFVPLRLAPWLDVGLSPLKVVDDDEEKRRREGTTEKTKSLFSQSCTIFSEQNVQARFETFQKRNA